MRNDTMTSISLNLFAFKEDLGVNYKLNIALLWADNSSKY